MNGMLLQIGAAFAAIPAAFLVHVLQTATNKRLKTRIVTAVSAITKVIVALNQHSTSSTTNMRRPRTSEENGHAQLQSQVELCIVLELCHQR